MVDNPTPTDTPQDPAVADPVDPNVTPEDPQTPKPETEEPTLLGDKGENPPKEPGQEQDEPKGDTPTEGIPEKYEFKLGEGIEVDQETLDLFSPVFKELGLDNEKAQKLVDAYVPLVSGMEERLKQQSLDDFKDIVKGWKADTLKELGPDSDKKLATCAKAINHFGDDNFRAALDQTGLGNHPEFVKFMIKVGNTIKEDTFIDPKNQMPGSTPQDQLNNLYPTMKK